MVGLRQRREILFVKHFCDGTNMFLVTHWGVGAREREEAQNVPRFYIWSSIVN